MVLTIWFIHQLILFCSLQSRLVGCCSTCCGKIQSVHDIWECCNMFVQDKDGVLRIAEDVSSATISVSILSLQSVCRAGDLAVNVFTGFDGWPCSCWCHRRRDRIYSSSGTVTGPYFMNVVHPVFRAKTWWTRSPEPCSILLCVRQEEEEALLETVLGERWWMVGRGFLHELEEETHAPLVHSTKQ